MHGFVPFVLIGPLGQLIQGILFPAPISFIFDEHLKIVIVFLILWGVVAFFISIWFIGRGDVYSWFYGLFTCVMRIKCMLY